LLLSAIREQPADPLSRIVTKREYSNFLEEAAASAETAITI
jgi:hypothetical protein